MRLRTGLVALFALAAGACGSDESPSPAADCTQGIAPLAQALASAPARVALEDGTRLSECVSQADDDAELQEVATGVTVLADRLAREAVHSDTAALRLGYLIGAVRRGARHTGGIHAELVRRLDTVAQPVPARRRTALDRGLAAGERAG